MFTYYSKPIPLIVVIFEALWLVLFSLLNDVMIHQHKLLRIKDNHFHNLLLSKYLTLNEMCNTDLTLCIINKRYILINIRLLIE